MSEKEFFTALKNARSIEPFVFWAKAKGHRIGRGVVDRALQRIEDSRELTARQKFVGQLAAEYLRPPAATNTATTPYKQEAAAA